MQFFPIFSIGGVNLDHNFIQVSKLSEDQKKKIFGQDERLFSANSSEDQRSDADQSQIIGGDADVDHTQIIGGYTPTPGFGTPGYSTTMLCALTLCPHLMLSRRYYTSSISLNFCEMRPQL